MDKFQIEGSINSVSAEPWDCQGDECLKFGLSFYNINRENTVMDKDLIDFLKSGKPIRLIIEAVNK